MLFYTGITRTADTILGEQKANIPDRLAQLQQLKDLAAEAVAGVRSGCLEVVGLAMGKSWEAKRELAQGVSTTALDDAVDAAMRVGATGAKVTGAGGGGFVLVMCPVEQQESVRTALAPMKDLPIAVDPYGSRVIFNVHRNIWS